MKWDEVSFEGWSIFVGLALVLHAALIVVFMAGRDGPDSAASGGSGGAAMTSIALVDAESIAAPSKRNGPADLQATPRFDLAEPYVPAPIDGGTAPQPATTPRFDVVEPYVPGPAEGGMASPPALAQQGSGRGAALLPFDMLPVPSPPTAAPAKTTRVANDRAAPPPRPAYQPPDASAPPDLAMAPPPRSRTRDQQDKFKSPDRFGSVHGDAPGAVSPAVASAGGGSSPSGVGLGDAGTSGASGSAGPSGAAATGGATGGGAAGGATGGAGAGAGGASASAGASAGPGGASASASASAGGASASASASAGPGGASASAGVSAGR